MRGEKRRGSSYEKKKQGYGPERGGGEKEDTTSKRGDKNSSPKPFSKTKKKGVLHPWNPKKREKLWGDT